MSLGIYTIILAIFRPPIIMLSLRVGYDYTRPWVYENAQLKTFCLGNDDKFRTQSRKAFSIDMRLKLTGKEGGGGGGSANRCSFKVVSTPEVQVLTVVVLPRQQEINWGTYLKEQIPGHPLDANESLVKN